jgi:hypothetical protein
MAHMMIQDCREAQRDNIQYDGKAWTLAELLQPDNPTGRAGHEDHSSGGMNAFP